jgi:hypothetical protein
MLQWGLLLDCCDGVPPYHDDDDDDECCDVHAVYVDTLTIIQHYSINIHTIFLVLVQVKYCNRCCNHLLENCTSDCVEDSHACVRVCSARVR